MLGGFESDNECLSTSSSTFSEIASHSSLRDLLIGEQFTVWSWSPELGEFRSFGKIASSSREDWESLVHREDRASLADYLDRDWRRAIRPEELVVRFEIPGKDAFVELRLSGQRDEGQRHCTIIGIAQPVLEARSHSSPGLDLSRSVNDCEATLASFRREIGADVAAIVEIDERGNPGPVRHCKESAATLTALQTISVQSSSRESIGSFDPHSFSLPWHEGRTFSLPRDGRRPALVLIWGTSHDSGQSEDCGKSEMLARIVLSSYRLESERMLRRQSEQLVNQCQRLTGVGKLATGIAHDFNNLLTVIQGHTTFLERALESKDRNQAEESIDLIQHATQQAIELAKQLLFFSREDAGRIGRCDLNSSAASFVKMVQRMVEETITIEIRLDNAVDTVACEPGALCQVLMNLIVNARDAMPNGGTITIESFLARLDNGRRSEFATLRVSDTGAGISASDLSRIFDPFFSTKGETSGTGLGLANVASIMRQIGGQVDVTSQIGRGTTFELLFPLAAPAEKSDQPRNELVSAGSGTGSPCEPPPLEGAKVLLVEDDSAIRKMVRKLLELFGCAVIEAGSGKEALELWESVENDISIIVTDVVMPEGVSGWDLAIEIHRRQPDLPILVTSGYGERPEDHGLENEPQIDFLQKPYESEEFRDRIEALLSAVGTEAQ
ncbi:MAG: ATP-binding protein [Verrucomicrobiota bacterium]